MKKWIALLLALVLCMSFAACSAETQETVATVQTTEQPTETTAPVSGINDDGMGEDPTYGEGVGEVIALTPEEESYMMEQTTNSWLEMTQEEKDALVVLIGRSLEASHNFIVEDYAELVTMLDHQMEQYFRNNVDERVYDTVCDILNVQ